MEGEGEETRKAREEQGEGEREEEGAEGRKELKEERS